MPTPELSPWVLWVVAINGLIALVGFYIAWTLWQVRNTLAEVADTVLEWERNTHEALDPTVTPPAILEGASQHRCSAGTVRPLTESTAPGATDFRLARLR
jgi:hypothetical protein